jgi:hypothetical protein
MNDEEAQAVRAEGFDPDDPERGFGSLLTDEGIARRSSTPTRRTPKRLQDHRHGAAGACGRATYLFELRAVMNR